MDVVIELHVKHPSNMRLSTSGWEGSIQEDLTCTIVRDVPESLINGIGLTIHKVPDGLNAHQDLRQILREIDRFWRKHRGYSSIAIGGRRNCLESNHQCGTPFKLERNRRWMLIELANMKKAPKK
jgi:hypothetical protein